MENTFPDIKPNTLYFENLDHIGRFPPTSRAHLARKVFHQNAKISKK